MEKYEENRRKRRNSVNRCFFAAVCVILQVALVLAFAFRLTEFYAYFQLAASALALIFVMRVYTRDSNSAYKILWIIILLVMPVFGICLFGLFGRKGINGSIVRHFSKIHSNLSEYMPDNHDVLQQLKDEDRSLGNQAHYLQNVVGYPIYQNTKIEYFGDTVKALESMKSAMREAKHFIFMEYHAIEDSVAWHGIEDILAQKAAEGLEVRIIYDDMGSLIFIDRSFIRHLEKLGIKCVDFNPLGPILNTFVNNRDHRKITVIDGVVGFTGGFNLADEYFNLTHPYGVWKDSGIRLEGDAVRSLTITFLEMWAATHRENSNRSVQRDSKQHSPAQLPVFSEGDGYVIPYADNPLDRESTGENVYLNIIKNAKNYVYIATPYLICSDEMQRELTLAARRGVDVRIITPGIPDKRIIYRLTRSYYAPLLERGVRIFEYTPGFMHAKQFVADDEVAVVGTINIDFRSLYLHFENACWFCHSKAVIDVRDDFEGMFSECKEVSGNYPRSRSLTLRALESILRLFSPLL